eukprot:GHVT01001953.1.p1 GENE.GHVT01001953.1~~GHVT01001953.1.p1  ORF type:complete len:211 (+),score=52.44 GHVT01001953.1:621-1253(+)
MISNSFPLSLEGDDLASAQREANLYALIRTVEQLEQSFVNGAVRAEEYEAECTTLIAQFKTMQRAVRETIPDVSQFMKEHQMACPLASDRLLFAGVPATRLYKTGGRKQGQSRQTLLAFELSGNFITLLDALKLNEKAVDALQPLLEELMASLHRIDGLPPALSETSRMAEWLEQLHGLRAHHELTATQCRYVLGSKLRQGPPSGAAAMP